jgi:ParB family transcriptional regulator, chromosome partitioning protein
MQIELHQLELRYAALRAADPVRQRKLLAELCEVGQQVPVVVVSGSEGRFVLIDGYARVSALQSLRRDTVEATIWAMAETEALIAQFHLQARARSTLEQAWLLERLSEEGISQEEIARRLCRTKSWVSRRMGLLKVLAPEVRAKVACGQIPPQAAMKYLLPLARANAEHALKLVQALGAHRVSVRQMGRLYGAWRAADGVGRERLVSSPLLFLQMEAETERHKVVQPPEVERLIQDLGAAAGICGRASRRIRGAITSSELQYARRRVLAAWDNARGALVRLGEEIDGRLTEDDRLRDPQGDLHPAQKGAEPAGDRSGSASQPQHGQTGCT